MKTRVLLIIAVAGLLASCAKEADFSSEATAQKTYLTVGIGTDSKTYMGDLEEGARKVYWSNGDQIAVNGTASAALEGLADNSRTATFSFDGVVSTPYNVLYPASVYTDATHVTLPAIQTYKAGGFADKMLPLAGYTADGSSISLSHLSSIVKISVLRAAADADTDNIAAVRFSGRNSEKVSGTFTLDYSTPALAAESGTGTDLEVRVNKELATSTSEAVVYYLVIPARTYENGFDIIVQDVNGHIMTKSKSGSWTAVPGKLYNMPEFEFAPTGTELGIEIASAEDLIAFATAYNNGEYDALGSSLIATVTADLTFDATSSAAFNATGGIGTKEGVGSGTADNYFDGTFNGGSHTISGLSATVPLFVATQRSASIKDLTIDNTCSFTFTNPGSGNLEIGSVVGYHRGTLDNVSVAADVTLAEVADVTSITALGGLVGRIVVGSIENGCVYSGLISTPAGYTSTGYVRIGGLAGEITNAEGSVRGSFFKGAISNAAQVTSTDKTNPYLIIGGIVGYLLAGEVSSCESTADHADVESAYSGFVAKIVNKTEVAYHSAVGGIVGESVQGTISDCTNAATIGCSIFKGSDATGRYMRTGGIVGKNGAESTVTGCVNNATVQHRSNPRLQSIGGIAGWNAGTINACTNNAAVNHMTSGESTAAGRVVSIGGVIGENYADNKISDVHNTANLEISSMEDSDKSAERLGGVIGYNEGNVVGGASKDITNSGQVYHSPNFTTQFLGYYVGGIVGLTTASVKNAKNTGRTYFRWQGSTLGASGVCLGGIAGKAEGASSTIENCENIVDGEITNSAQVYLYLPGTAGHNNNYVGGIVGLSEATAPVKDCTNGGEVRTAAGASTVPVTGIMVGGIIGKMTGSGEVDNADNGGRVRINFTLCTAEEDIHSGNYLGGIAGYVSNVSSVTITNCDNSGQVDISCGSARLQDIIASGVVGKMDAPGFITNSNNNGGAIQMAITANSNGPKDLYTAGILGYSTNDVSISGCSNTGAISGGNSTRVDKTAYYTGGIVAYLKGASKILDCSNTGSTVSTHAGNNDTIGSTALTAGIAGYVEGTSEVPIEIGGTTGCTVNTTTALSATRGWIAGVAAYAKYAQISNCTIESIIGGGCAARGAGGIVGKAEYCTISSCYYNGDTIKANQIQAGTGEGGIVANADNSTIDGCYCYATMFYNNNSNPFGGIVGISNASNTIRNCHYKSAVQGPTAGTNVTATIAGTGTYTDGGGNAADL